MRNAIVLAALCTSACAGAPADPSTVPTKPSLVADTCAVARPDLGGVATEADAGHGLNQQALFDRHDWLREQIGLDARQ